MEHTWQTRRRYYIVGEPQKVLGNTASATSETHKIDTKHIILYYRLSESETTTLWVSAQTHAVRVHKTMEKRKSLIYSIPMFNNDFMAI